MRLVSVTVPDFSEFRLCALAGAAALRLRPDRHFFSTDGSSDFYGGPLSRHDSRFANKLIVSLVQEIPGSTPAHYSLTCAGSLPSSSTPRRTALRIKWHGDVYAEIQLPLGLNVTDQQLMQMGAKLQIRDDSEVPVG